MVLTQCSQYVETVFADAVHLLKLAMIFVALRMYLLRVDFWEQYYKFIAPWRLPYQICDTADSVLRRMEELVANGVSERVVMCLKHLNPETAQQFGW